MADQVQDIGIRIRADGVVETSTGVKLTADALDKLAPKATAAGKAMDAAAIGANQTTWAYRQLPMHITDVVTSLASGQKPWMEAIQQGGQIKDSFGGIVPAARALLGLLNPLNVAIGAGAIAGGGLAAAYYQGWQQSRALSNALALTGNQAGITEGQFNNLVGTLARARNAGTGNVRELMQAIVAGGQTSGMALESTGRAALALSKLNGQSAAENAKAFAGMADGVSAWAAKAQKSYGYLTAEQFKAIQALEAQGRTGEAARLNMEALAGTLESRTAPSIGTIERLLNAGKRTWSDWWDAAAGLGRAETVDEQLAKLQAKLEKARAPVFGDWIKRGDGKPFTGRDSDAAAIETEIDALRRERGRRDLRTLDNAAALAAENEKILKASRGYQDSLTAIQSAGDANQLAAVQAGAEARRTTLEMQYQRGLLLRGQYMDGMIAIERQQVAAEEAAARKSMAIEAGRVVTTEQEVNARTAAVLGAQGRLIAAQGKRAALEAKIRADGFAPNAPPPARSMDPGGDFRRSEIQAQNEMDRPFTERVVKAGEAAQELLATNKTLAADLIKDDRARAEAQLAIEAEQVRQRLQLSLGSVAERQQKEAAFADWMTLRTKKLTEDLKPEWQKMLEAWGDTTRQMRETGDAVFTSFLRGGEDAFVQLMTTGKLSITSLMNTVVAEIARAQFRQMAASFSTSGGVASLINAGLAFFGGGTTTGGTGTVGPGLKVPAGGLHSGGIGGTETSFTRAVPATVFAGAPRFHTGIGPGEMPAVIKRDEGVFTPGQMRAMAPVDAVARAAGPRITYAPTINIDSRTDRAEVAALVGQAVRAGQADLLEQMDRGMMA